MASRQDMSLADYRRMASQRIQQAASAGAISHDEASRRIERCRLAKTFDTLDELVSDLPAVAHAIPAVETRPSLPEERYEPVSQHSAADDKPAAALRVSDEADRPSHGFVGAVFGGGSRKGTWVAPHSITCPAIFGSVKLDFSKALLAPVTTVICCSLFGSVELVVPKGVKVTANGVGIFGAFNSTENDGSRPLCEIKLSGVALFGSVGVKVREANQ